MQSVFKRYKDIILAIVSGMLLIFAFPPFDIFPLAWFALLPLLIAIYEKRAKPSFLLGILSGLVFFLGTIYWVFHPVYFYGGMPLVVAVLITILLAGYLSLYTGLFSMAFSSLSKRTRFPAIFIAPLLWTTLEFIRSYALTGFPWVLLGYSQYRFLPLIQVSDITGVYGITFLVVGMNGLLFDMLFLSPQRSRRMPLLGSGPMTVGAIVYVLVVIISLIYGEWMLSSGDRGRSFKVSVIQGNIRQDVKWDKRFQDEVIDKYKRLMLKALDDSPDIIVLPESALPFIFGYDSSLTNEFLEFQKGLGRYLLFGSVLMKDIKDGRSIVSNSAVLLSPDGEVVSTYDKIHLVPYGEYVPMRSLFPFIDKLVVAIGDFVKGKEYVVMKTPFADIGNLICYEIIFPGLVRKFVNNGANLLVTITNDAWFGRTSAPYQHFSMAIFRAVENRTPVIRSANTGISGFIDARGRIIKKGGIFKEEVLSIDVSTHVSKKTFYTRYGDLFAFSCIIVTVMLMLNMVIPERED
ncbi:MAG: apolipoprotein N-acyltransferase [Thermodesulfovibrionia bacterium]